MKLSFTTTAFLLAVTVSALPYNGAQISEAPAKRQVPVDQPAMAVGGNIVPYANPAGAKVKRQSSVPVDQPSMAVAGNIVPYSNPGSNA